MNSHNTKEILEFVKNKNDNIEIEIRFGSFTDSKFVPEISEKKYKEFFDFLSEKAVVKNTEYSFIAIHDYNNENLRITQTLESLNNSNSSEILFPWLNARIINDKYDIKKRIKNFDYKENNVRVAISEENIIKPFTIDTNLHKPMYFKSMKRDTFIFKDDYKIELSIFKSSNDINLIMDSKFKFDIEIELISSNNTFNTILRLVSFLNTCIMEQEEKVENTINTENVTCVKDANYIENKYKKITRGVKKIGAQPETLRESKLVKDEIYAVSMKIDGVRNKLFISDNKIFSVDNKCNFVFICNTILDDDIILDCELMDNGTFICFDIIYYNADCDIDLIKRIEMMKEIIQKINKNNIIIKEYYFGDLYKNIMKYKKAETYSVDYPVDGILLTPVYSRKVLKWKKYDTIDFKIKKTKEYTDNKEKWVLYCSSNTVFTHSYSKNLGEIYVDKKEAENYPDKCVIEFIFDLNKKSFVILKQREDKIDGNYITVARDNFETTISPFDFNILKKNNTTVIPRTHSVLFDMRRFHNWIKRSILETYSGGSLLDLACGKGGDIYKWVDYNIKYVEGYDKDVDSINHAKVRYSKILIRPETKNYEFVFDNKDLLQEKIVSENKFESVSCFFAIHYFFKNEKDISNLIESMKNVDIGGHVLVTTIDGDKLHGLNYTLETENISIKPLNIDFKKEYGNSVSCYIKDSVLNNERDEYVVFYDILVNIMKKNGFSLVTSSLFNEYYEGWCKNNNSLTEEEKKYSFINRAYVFKKLTDTVATEVVEETRNENLKKLPVKTLKEICRKNDFPISGTKQQLIERIIQNNLE